MNEGRYGAKSYVGVLRKIDGAFAHSISWVISFEICQNRKPSMEVSGTASSLMKWRRFAATCVWKVKQLVVTVMP